MDNNQDNTNKTQPWSFPISMTSTKALAFAIIAITVCLAAITRSFYSTILLSMATACLIGLSVGEIASSTNRSLSQTFRIMGPVIAALCALTIGAVAVIVFKVSSDVLIYSPLSAILLAEFIIEKTYRR